MEATMRSAAENLGANLRPSRQAVAQQEQMNREIARALYPNLAVGVAEKTWQDTFQVFNETSKAAGVGFASGGGPVGAVAAGLAKLITGVIQATAEGKLRRSEATRWAHALGIEDASDFPSFIVDLQGMGLRERLDVVHELNGILNRPGLTPRRQRKIQQRKDAAIVLIHLDAAQQQRLQTDVVAAAAESRRQQGTSLAAAELARRQARANRGTLRWLGVAAVLGSGATWLLTR